jgi:hypothetical protein
MKLSLNEAFRYQNFLTKMRTDLSNFLEDDYFVITRTEEHYRKDAAPGLVNETITQERDEIYSGITPNEAIKLLSEVNKEREKLSVAIHKSKQSVYLNSGIGIDEAVMLNKERRAIANVFKYLAFLKPIPQRLKRNGGSVYKFTESEKNGAQQVMISYDVMVKSAIDYDRNNVKSEYKRLLKEADSISSEIDEIFAGKTVEFEMAYDIRSTIHEIIEDKGE